MATKKISALSSGTTANATDKIPIERSGGNAYITPAYLLTYITGLTGLIARAHTSASVSHADGSTDIINFNTKDSDPLSAITTGASWSFTVPASMGGWYEVKLEQPYVNPDGNTWVAGGGCSIDLYKNTSYLATVGYEEAEATGSNDHWLFLTGSFSLSLAAADTIDLRFNNFSGDTHARKLGSNCGVSIYRWHA